MGNNTDNLALARARSNLNRKTLLHLKKRGLWNTTNTNSVGMSIATGSQ